MLAAITSVEPVGNTRLAYDVKVVKYQLVRDLKNNNTDAQGQFYTPRYQGACGVSFEAGRTALVMLSKNNEAHSCGGSEIDMGDALNEGAGAEAGQSEESKRKRAVLQEIEQLHAELQRHGASACTKRKPSSGSISPSAASPQGTLNDATPGGPFPFVNISPVLSYATQDLSTGNPVVLNVTQPGHPLFPGYVARYVTPTQNGNVVNNMGEGSGWVQSPSNPLAPFVNGVWNAQTNGIINNIRNGEGAIPPSPAAGSPNSASGGFAPYPSNSNNNSLTSVYRK